MVGPLFLFVGAVLFLNGLWILGYIGDREIAVINIFVGGLGLVVTAISFLQGQPATYEFGGYVLLFAFTYLWVAWNRFSGVDGRGLGWFCLFVALTAVPVALTVLSTTGGKPWLIWLGLDWAAWAVLWFLYFVLLALGRASIGRFVGWLTLVEGILTAWIPGYLVMSGRLLTA
ncbi:MAG: transporter [Chloroflexi bacterium]|nr:transporter [Chloroflexota bacterium]